MSQQILLTLNDTAGNALGQYNINTAGSALHIQAVDGAYYQFTDPMTGIGPEGIITEREGDNLLVSFDEGTDLVIENYFAQNEPGALVGMQADGGLMSYPVATAPEHVLAEEIAASQALGSEQPVWAPLGVLGAVGLVAAGIGLATDDSGKGWDNGNHGGSGSGGSGNNPSPNTPAPNPSPNNPSNPSNPGGPNIPSPNPGNPGNPGTPTPTPNPSPYPPAPSPNPVPQPPTPNQPGSDPKPIANHDKVKGTPKEKVTIDVLDNDSGMDANGQRDLNPSSIRLLDAAGKPVTELTVAGQGKWNVSFGKVTFTPEPNFTGNPTPVQYTVSDNAGQVSNKATITVTYNDNTPGANHQGRAVITGDAKVGQTLGVDINDPDGVPTTGVKYQWMANGVAIAGATGPTYTLSAADKGKTISLNISYTDNQGNSENISTLPTAKVADGVPTPQPPQPGQNHPGSVAISGNAKVGEKLTADVHDDDQFDASKVKYQWLRDGKEIAGANGKTYTLTADDEGHKVSVKAEYTDNAGHKESLDSSPTAQVQPSSATNHAPTDITLANNSVIEGKDGATVGKLTTTDPDAGDKHTYKVSDSRFEVTADGTLKLKAGQHLDYASEKTVTLQITSDDGHGGTVNKTLTLNVQDDPNYPTPNPQPPTPPGTNHEGTVTITGEAKVGETLTAKVDDADGVPTNVQYQWLANGVAIAGATGSSYQLTAAEAGKTISVRATYTDNAQHSEAPTSSATAPVVDPANPNPQPPVPPANHEGTVTIAGDAKVGETLTATVNDDDGVPANVTYQWLANGVAIAGATGSSYQLTAAEAGKTITVRATYTDNAQHSEAPISTATAPVVDPANPNPQPPVPPANHEGTVTIAGDAKVGETLTATVNDDDGVPANVTYQWLANGVAIAGATGSSYQLTAAEAGKTITVRATYTDNAQHSEAPTSAATTPVVDPANPNPQPPQPQPNHEGDVAISGNAKVGETLTAQVHDADQFDEAKVNYQWQRDGQPIASANSKTYTLTAEDEGHKITVKATYTDNAGHKESHDAESGVVQPQTSTNHAPTDINLDNDKVAEGKDGAAIGKLTTTDPDAGDQHTYKVSDDRFEVTADGTLKLKDGKHLDYANEKTVTLQITTDDGHGGSYNKTFTLNVEDDPNYPPVNPPQPQPNHEGTVTISGDAKVGETLTAKVDDADGVPTNVQYQWLANGVAIAGATGSSYQLTANDAGKTITVRATYTDNAQHSEAPTSAATTPVVDPANPNPQPPVPPTNHEGTVSITGEAKVGETLTATVNDDDGVPANVSYQWLANGVAIAGATGSSYQLTAAEAGKTISVRATYTDNAQHSEAPTSAATAPVVDPANPNPQPPQPQPNHEGTVTITGEAKVGETLTATVNDDDGVPANVTYQWLANGVAIAGATGSSYQLTAAEAGKTISVRATYTDNAQHSEAPTSAATTPVVDPANPNPQPPVPPTNHEGTVSITGEAKVGETLTAKVDDADGVPTNVQYQWLANGVAIAGATGSSYQLTAAEAGKTISVRATYTDNAQHSEAPTSAATTPVVDPANPNPQPPTPPGTNHEGTVTISGEAKVGETLTAKVDDADGVPTNVQYQWLANGVAIAGATGSSYQLTANDAGKTISVRATYTDNAQHSEAPISAATTPVVDPANPNPQPPVPPTNHEGTVTITGEAKVGETLTATVNDDDGVPANVTYQWLANGVAIAGATGSSYQLTANDAGKTISVRATYTDNANHSEAPTSAATTPVVDPANPNPQPPVPPTNHEGTVTITGEAKVGETLTATVNDDDGVPANVTYQWLANGVAIAGATGSSYQLTAAEAGKTISVRATYTDNAQHSEAPISGATAPVVDPANPNPQPPQPQPNHEGTVTISGDAKVGETLTATVNDDDGVPANVTYQWLANGVAIAGATGSSYQLTAAEAGKTISVRATYTDNAQHSEAPTSAATTPVVDPTNPQPPQPQPNHEGTVSITGEAKVGETLTATVNDDDGVPANVTYQWLANGVAIAGATGSSYQLTAAEAGKTITVRATYTDNAQHSEAPTSAATTPVVDPANPNPQPPTPPGTNHGGTVTISGDAKVGETLTAKVDDADGVPTNVQYQWLANGVAIAGATGSSYQLTAAEAGKTITVRATYTDNAQHSEAPTSAATTPVVDPANPNPQPPVPPTNHEGTVSITGEAKVGETLTAKVDDADGVPTNVQYQWLANGVVIAGATGSSYQLTAAEAGKTISVRATYTDNAQHSEAPISAATTPVVDPANPNPQPPQPQPNHEGDVAISGNAKVGETLTAQVHDADQFDEAKVNYQWQRDGQDITGANGKTYTLTAEDEGHKISVKAEYTDNAQHAETPQSGETDAVTGNTPPGGNHEGTVTISGNAKVGETLAAEVQDQDGVPDTGVTYQWLRDGKEIAGATGKSYTLTADDVGQKISVKATYEDGAQHAEAPTSAETEAVTQIDNNQPGSVTIVHPQNIETGAVLRAVIDDSDGVPTAGVLYQWLRDGKPINHANPVARYELRSEDEGHDISVHVEYTDKNGHKESLTSEPLNFPEDKGPDFTLERGTGTEQGGVTLIPTEKATIADLNYEKNGLSQNVHIVRADANSPWHSDDPLPQGVTLDAKTGVLKVAPQEVDDGSQVYASVYEGRSSKTLYLITENDVGNPPLPQSEAEVSFYTTDSIIEGNAQSYVVRLSKPAETDVTVELKISHVSTNESQIHAETRTITIPKGQISKTVFVETEDDKQFSADPRFQAELQNPQGAKLADQDTSAVTRIIDNDGPQAPVLKAGSEVGGVEILPQEGAKILHVYYQSEADGSTQDFVATRNNDGRWTAREPHDRVTLDAQTGKVTLGALAVQDRSEVRAFNESELHVRSEESKIFAGDNPASPPPAVNQQGTVTISGDPKVGSTLTAEVKDGDGVPSDGVKYQWLRDGNPIASATGKSYVLTAEDAGHKITVKAEYDDNAKHHETPVSQPTENIADNAPPAVNQQGAVTISGDPKVGSTLTAEVKDGDGVPSDGVKYQWLRDGNPIASATGKSYVLTAEDAGHKITVKAEYDDNAKNHETPVSQPTENIADNSAPPPAANHPGSVTLEGEAKIGHTLTAKLTDADGVPDSGITWRWYGDDKLLPGVEGQTITLTDAVKGMQLRAEAVYTDKAGHAEKPISDLSPAVVPEAANNSDLFPPPAADAPHITLSGVTSVKEGEKATYTVSLDKPASEDVSVDVHVKHNSTDTSDANLTYKIQRVVIPKGETSKNFTVDTHNDGKAEGTETYTVEIGNALVGNVNDNVPPFSGSVSAQSMIIPAYKYPTGAWQPDTYWESVHKAGGGKVPYVIVNPASGVGEKVNSDYAKLIDDNITAGIKNIGYIRTHYQTRPIEEVKAEVDKYLELYGKDKIHGYFFDEITAQNNQGTAYMAELYRYVKAKAGDKLVMANPGTHITDAIAPYADIFVTSEVSAKTYLNNYEQPKSAFENDPKNAHRIMHMIHDVTPDQYDAVIKASRERNAGWVFPTSDTQENPLPEAEREKHPEQDGNPYNALPQNFDQLAANVNNLGMPTNPTQHDNNGKLATANIDNNHVTTEIVDANNAAPLEHHEPQLQTADGAVASAADGLEAAAADHSHGSDGHDVLIGDGIDAAAYSQLVSHQGEDLLQYLGQHSAELLAASQQSASHELHGGAGDDVLIAGHGAQLLEGGAGADTFAYLLDSNDAASWNEPSRILDFNPQEGDRIVLAGGEHLKAEVSHDASGQHLHVTDDAGHSRTIDIGAQNGKTLTAEDILSHVEIRTPQGYSEPASSVPQTHHLPQDDHSHLI